MNNYRKMETSGDTRWWERHQPKLNGSVVIHEKSFNRMEQCGGSDKHTGES